MDLVGPSDEVAIIGTLDGFDVTDLLDAGADQYLADNRNRNTARGYESDWRTWQHYCGDVGIPETSNSRGALVGFVLWMENKPPSPRDLDADPNAPHRPQAPNTIDRRLASVMIGLSSRGVEPDRATRRAARQALDVYRRRLAKEAITVGRGKAVPVTPEHLRAISQACPPTLAGIRDRAVVLIGFRMASRSHELGDLKMVDIKDVQGHGIVVEVRVGKTGSRRIPMPPARDESLCPVTAWRAWRAVATWDEGPAFAQIDKSDRVRRDKGELPLPVGPRAIRRIIARARMRAGVDVHLTGHSLRAGFATEARRAGHDAKTISDITGHSPTSKVLYEYFRTVDEWREAPKDIV